MKGARDTIVIMASNRGNLSVKVAEEPHGIFVETGIHDSCSLEKARYSVTTVSNRYSIADVGEYESNEEQKGVFECQGSEVLGIAGFLRLSYF